MPASTALSRAREGQLVHRISYVHSCHRLPPPPHPPTQMPHVAYSHRRTPQLSPFAAFLSGISPGSLRIFSERRVPPSGFLRLHLHVQAIDRRERLRRLALETIDLTKDPYFMRNHLGQYECRLCLTLHNNEGNYLAHTQARLPQQTCPAAAASRTGPVQLTRCPAIHAFDGRWSRGCRAKGTSRTWRSEQRGRRRTSRWLRRRSAAST